MGVVGVAPVVRVASLRGVPEKPTASVERRSVTPAVAVAVAVGWRPPGAEMGGIITRMEIPGEPRLPIPAVAAAAGIMVMQWEATAVPAL